MSKCECCRRSIPELDLPYMVTFGPTGYLIYLCSLHCIYGWALSAIRETERTLAPMDRSAL